MPARPVWNTVLLPATYLASAAVLGLFTLNILAAKQQEEVATLALIRKATIVALAVQSVVLLCYLGKIVIAPFPDPTRSLTRLLAGDLAIVFWVLVVLVGLVLPYRLLTGKAIHNSANIVRLTSTGLACAVIGGTAFRALLYVMGTTVFKF
jgi:anaerobic dimethyl sulfoxide reductase subunit C (anchor subunit)